jgi:hypothetical protein
VHEGLKDTRANELANSVQGLKMTCQPDNASDASHRSAGRDRVSFGTYMSTNEEISDDGSVQLSKESPQTAVEQFHARKFQNKAEGSGGNGQSSR